MATSEKGFLEYKEKISSMVHSFLGQEEDTEETIKLPPIPKVKKNSKRIQMPLPPTEKSQLLGADKKHFDYLFVKELFLVVLNRKAVDSDLQKWLNVLSQGGAREGVYRGLVLGTEFAELEKEEHPSKPIVAEFVSFLMNKFLNRKIDNKVILELNFFAVKRLVTESFLDVADELAKKKENLHDWYAVLSRDLVVKFPYAWRNKMRQDSRAKSHKLWASKVPEQHIKSEIIIKLHKILNTFDEKG